MYPMKSVHVHVHFKACDALSTLFPVFPMLLISPDPRLISC
jgi:hypothetical protein